MVEARVAAAAGQVHHASVHQRRQILDELDILAEHLVGHSSDRALRCKADIQALVTGAFDRPRIA